MQSCWYLIPKHNPDALLRLICFPYSGGGASLFYQWPSALPLSVEIISVQFPGRENRIKEPLIQQMNPLIDEVYKALEPFFNQKVAFLGYSMGAVVAFELARKMRREGSPLPCGLFTAACNPPQQFRNDKHTWHLPDEEFIAVISAYKGIPAEILQDFQLISLLLPKLRADTRILETYRYIAEKPLPVPIFAYSGQNDQFAMPIQVEKWKQQTDVEFCHTVIPGEHFFLQSHRLLFLSELAKSLDLLMSG